MPFADLSTEGWIGIIGTVVTPLVGGIVLLLNTLHKNRKENAELKLSQQKAEAELRIHQQVAESDQRQKQEENTIDQWRELYNLQQDQLNKLSMHIASQDAMINELVQADSECQVELANLYGSMQLIHSSLVQCCHALHKLGVDDFQPMPMPDRPKRRSSTAKMEFMRRHTAQDSVTLSEITEKMKTQPLPGEK